MTPEQKEMADSIIKQVQDGMLTKESVEQMLDEKTKGLLNADALKEINDAVKEQGLMLKKIQEQGPEKIKSVREILQENHDAIKSALKDRKHLEINFKTNVLRTSVTSSTISNRLPDIGQAAYAGTPLRNLFRRVTGVFPNAVIRYADQTTVTRSATTISEAGAYPESALAWTEYTLQLEKIGDTIPVSEEAMMDLDFVASEIERLLNVNISLKEEQQLWAGTGSTPQIYGAYAHASAFNSGAYTGYKPADANLYDLIRVMAVQIMNGKESKYKVTAAIINPADTLQLDLNKDSEGRYLIPPFAIITPQGEVTVKGVQVIECPAVTANTMLIGDFNMGTIYQQEGFTAELGYGDGQFVKDLMTLKARIREGLLIRTVDVGAFLKSTDITTDITNITAAGS